MPFFSISCVRIETAAATAAGSCRCCLRCCLRCYSGGGCAEFLSGIIARARATTWLPDPPLRHGALPFVCFAAFLWLLCQLFLLHQRQQEQQEQAQRLRVFLCPGNAIRIVCLGSFSPCQDGRQEAEQQSGTSTTLSTGRQWQVGVGVAVGVGAELGVSVRARPLLPECALVNKIYCEDARVSWSWLGTE